MRPLKAIKKAPRKSLYKILDILTHNGLVWQILDRYESARSVYLREVLRAVMLCGDIKNGYSVHKCEDCGFEHKVGFSCGKSFCNRCGYRRTENWVRKARSKVLNVAHRHIIFTMPEVLWGIFAYARGLLKLIPKTGEKVIRLWGMEKGIVKHGMISFIHTFGYDIKWNPHGHFIVTEGGLTSDNKWRDWPWNRERYAQPYISFSFFGSKNKILPRLHRFSLNRQEN